MDPSLEDQFYAARQLDDQFRSPNILRRTIDDEAVVVHTVKKTRRAKSTEPTVLQADDPFLRFLPHQIDADRGLEEDNSTKRWSMLVKNQENMSKQELVNNYRLLMNEKLRLERFLSIMTKNHEMARNRLESDLLDAMMCIEDLKQVLEIKMARRRKIDPHEAEERRFLIRQNKKLLQQLTESAKKIERLEVTNLEMKEQLELLDFQIVEVENQKAMMEEELRKLPPNVNNETQTVDNSNRDQQIISNLKDQLDRMQTDLLNQKAETAAVLAKQSHLDNVVRELRRDNIELRDQLARVDDVENSLAESDKPMAADLIMLQTRLQEQTDHICELEEKLKSSKDYVKLLEDRLQSRPDDNPPPISILSRSEIMLASKQTSPPVTDTKSDTAQASMYDAMNQPFKLPRVDELLLQETIRTFQTLMDEKDQEISQLKQYVHSHLSTDQNGSGPDELQLPPIFESSTQTELQMHQANQLSSMIDQLNEGGHLLTSSQYQSLAEELKRSVSLLCGQIGPGSESDLVCQIPTSSVDFDYLLCAANAIRRKAEVLNWKMDEDQVEPNETNVETSEQNDQIPNGQLSEKDLRMQIAYLKSEIERLTRVNRTSEGKPIKTNIDELSVPVSHSSPSRFLSMDMSPNSESPTEGDKIGKRLNNNETDLTHSPQYYSTQLQDLRQTGEIELAKAHLNLSERRRHYLEQRITELVDELDRARAETRSAETSLSAARRTEAALRRRLLIAMDLNGSQTEGNLSRHSLGAPLNGVGEVRDVVELQANIVKLEATNASLVEAAQLDRTRIHDQAMRIEQLESDHRALMDRISSLQAAEAGAQRGIVRLQALYEDMLREYSESKCQEFSWRNRERAQSKNRSARDSKTVKPIPKSQSQNLPENQDTDQINSPALTNGLPSKLPSGTPTSPNESDQPIQVGSCQQSACISVRRLLDNVLTQLVDKQHEQTPHHQQQQQQAKQGLKHTTSGPILSDLSKSSPFMNELRNQLTFLAKFLNQSDLTDKQTKMKQHVNHCLRLLVALENWIEDCLNRQDAEVTGLRSKLLDLQLQADRLNSTLLTRSNSKNPNQSFTCSISLTKKPDLEAILSREHEILQLREQLQRLDAELRITKAKSDNHYVF